MTGIENSIQAFSPSLHVDLLGAATRQRLIMPFYHTVSDVDLPHIKHLYSVRNWKQFKNDLSFFLKNYVPVDLEALMNHQTEKEVLHQNSFFLSFDDGLSESYEIALLLGKLGVSATFFVNPAFVDNKDLFFRYKASLLIEALQTRAYSKAVLQEAMNCVSPHVKQPLKEQLLAITYADKHKLDDVSRILHVDFTDYLKQQKPYITREQLRTLIGQGFTVGAHSMDHPRYSQLSLKDQLEQTKSSMGWVSSEFKQQYNVFAFPFTDHNVPKDFFMSVFDQQHPMLDLSFGTAGMKKDIICKNLQRIPMEKSRKSAREIITKEYMYYLAKFPFGKNTIRRT